MSVIGRHDAMSVWKQIFKAEYPDERMNVDIRCGELLLTPHRQPNSERKPGYARLHARWIVECRSSYRSFETKAKAPAFKNASVV
jgi:hypothetical protein